MTEPKPLPSETPRSDEAYILRLLGRIADQERALASLADELRLAQTELKGCYRLIDELKEDLRLAREEQIALLRFVEHPVTPEMWKAMFAKEPR